MCISPLRSRFGKQETYVGEMDGSRVLCLACAWNIRQLQEKGIRGGSSGSVVVWCVWIQVVADVEEWGDGGLC